MEISNLQERYTLDFEYEIPNLIGLEVEKEINRNILRALAQEMSKTIPILRFGQLPRYVAPSRDHRKYFFCFDRDTGLGETKGKIARYENFVAFELMDDAVLYALS